MTALQARTYLSELEAERAFAVFSSLSAVDAYMADLDDEITNWRNVYVGAAVTEIATLRGELFGPQVG
jgi:hypothetical protein